NSHGTPVAKLDRVRRIGHDVPDTACSARDGRKVERRLEHVPGTTTPPQPPNEAPPARRKSAFGRQVRDALLHLHDLPYLQTHPLAAALLEPPQDRAANAGRLLQRRLLDAIDALQTGSGHAAASPFVRGHRLLQLRYVDGLEIPDVCDQLGLGESQYHRVHGRCLEAIVSLLDAECSKVSTSASGDAASVGATEGPAHGSGGLPYPVTLCIGRTRENDAARRLLDSARLVTMTGPPGVGKTRLSLDVAAAVSSDFPDGVFFVPLADVRSPSLVASAIARALD